MTSPHPNPPGPAAPPPRPDPTAAPPPTGGALARRLVREAWSATLAAKIPATVTLLIAAAVCAAALLTAGRSAATEASIAAHIDDAGTRVITVSDTGGNAGLTSDAVPRIAAISGVDSAVGVGPPFDVHTTAAGQGATPVGARVVSGPPPPQLHIRSGRWPGLGEATVTPTAAAQLGLAAAAGHLTAEEGQFDVVGTYTDTSDFADLGVDILLGPDTTSPQPLTTIYLLAHDAADVARIAAAAADLTGATYPEQIHITTSDTLVSLQRVISGDFGRFARQLALLIVGAGILLIAATLYGSVAARRREFGRRRALGANRTTLITLVLAQAAIPAAAGTILGAAAGTITDHTLTHTWPPTTYTLAVATLVTLAAATAALPAALTASLRDPVRTLRVP